jgi:hypothetical protein
MSTRSDIIRENLDGSFDRIYCHWDGYPSSNGKILLHHYTDPAKVDALIRLGDLSSLGPEIGEKHPFDQCPEGQCNAYLRDRGETGTRSMHFKTTSELAAFLKESWTEYCYFFRVADGKWYWTNNPSPTWFKTCGEKQLETELLTDAACEE